MASNIKSGVSIFGVTGTHSGSEDVTDETTAYTSKLVTLEAELNALNSELEGKAGGGGTIEYLELLQSVGNSTVFWSPTDVFIDSPYAKSLVIRANEQYDNIIKGTYISALTTFGGFPVVVNPSNAVELVRTIDSYNIYKINSSCSFTIDD